MTVRFTVVVGEPARGLFDLSGLIRAQLPEEFAVLKPDTASRGELADLVSGADVLVVRDQRADAELINSASHLKLIQKFGRRVGNIDLVAARAAGVPVATVTNQGCSAVAELTMTLVLALSKALLRAHESTAAAEYVGLGLRPALTSQTSHAFQWMKLPVFEVNGKVLGLIGMGEIGSETAIRARAFGMRIIYYQRRRLPEAEEREIGASYLSLRDLLQQADFVSLHIPHTSETEGMIGAEELAIMKSTAYLINTCRGGVVDEVALYRALSERSIAGAGLDVFREEPLPESSPLRGLGNVILTPHVGGGSGFGYDLTSAEIAAQILRVRHGQPPKDVVM